MKFTAAFALLAAVNGETIVEFDDSTLVEMTEDARDTALAHLDQQEGIEQDFEDVENVMEQENAPKDVEVDSSDSDVEDDENVQVDAESSASDVEDDEQEWGQDDNEDIDEEKLPSGNQVVGAVRETARQVKGLANGVKGAIDQAIAPVNSINKMTDKQIEKQGEHNA